MKEYGSAAKQRDPKPRFRPFTAKYASGYCGVCSEPFKVGQSIRRAPKKQVGLMHETCPAFERDDERNNEL